ncbi:hypothetical protein [Lacrimispora amygdalina]|uniref:hypothetical protein n=1 Tax=Lacrimispora amygdalina TaxID=253257 RepID=UPI000BE34175|nr:hypothetical protein [Lacrimispora amygdalina]
MLISVTEGKKDFTISFDIESIVISLNSQKKDYEKECYLPYGTFYEDEKCYTKKEYDENIDKMIEYVTHITSEDLESIIKGWTRKKNGTFNRRRTKELFDCENCRYICEWHYTWIYDQIKVIPISDTQLNIILYEKVDTPA